MTSEQPLRVLDYDREHTRYRHGLEAFTTPRGYRVLVLRLGADPDDTPEWIQKARRGYPSERAWRREMEGDWSSPTGDPYFPVFGEIGRERYIHMATRLIKGPVFRSFDFGRRRPACTWFQYSPKSDRLWGLREFMPHDLLTHEFRDAVRYLSGEVPLDAIPERAQRWVEVYGARPTGAHCPPPWFPLGTRFIDIGGKEALQAQANAQRPEEATARDIFGSAGMHLIMVNIDVKGRNEVVGRMLMLHPDGWPRTWLDPQMEEVIAGFEGAFSYATPPKGVEVSDKPKDDGHFINLLDAWGYGVVAVCPKDTPRPDAPPRLMRMDKDGRTPIYGASDIEEVGWYENRTPR